jgi:hypothetical protein
MARLKPDQVQAMLDRVNADLPRERNQDRASDLRILKMKLESLQEIRRLSEQTAVEGAPPGVTIH